MGSHEMIKPWPFMNYVSSGDLKSYWVQTSNIESIRTIMNPVLRVKVIQVLAELYDGNSYDIGELSTKMNYESSFDIHLILSFFVHMGYLAYHEKKVFMPNREIKYEWINCAFGVTDSGILDSSFQRNIMNALRAKPFNIIPLETPMREQLKSCSCFDLKSEHSYHMYYFGSFGAVCGPKALLTEKLDMEDMLLELQWKIRNNCLCLNSSYQRMLLIWRKMQSRAWSRSKKRILQRSNA